MLNACIWLWQCTSAGGGSSDHALLNFSFLANGNTRKLDKKKPNKKLKFLCRETMSIPEKKKVQIFIQFYVGSCFESSSETIKHDEKLCAVPKREAKLLHKIPCFLFFLRISCIDYYSATEKKNIAHFMFTLINSFVLSTCGQ